MTRICLPFPVLSGKTETDVRRIGEHFNEDPQGYAESRRRSGVTLERAYLQTTPMGSFVVAYLEGDKPLAEMLAAPAQSDLEIDRYFVQAVKEIHGVDLTQAPTGPAPELLGEWVDPAVTSTGKGMAFTAPLVPEMVDRARDWFRRTYASQEMTASRRALGQRKEIVTLVQTPQGPVGVVYLEGEDSFEGNRRFAASTDPFDVAFKKELKQLFPPFVNFDEPVPGVTEIFDSQELLAKV